MIYVYLMSVVILAVYLPIYSKIFSCTSDKKVLIKWYIISMGVPLVNTGLAAVTLTATLIGYFAEMSHGK